MGAAPRSRRWRRAPRRSRRRSRGVRRPSGHGHAFRPPIYPSRSRRRLGKAPVVTGREGGGSSSATFPRVNLRRSITDSAGEFLLFAVTPPRLTTSRQEARGIAEVTLERLRSLPLDGLVLYDIDDESDRNPDERPFPFLPTMDPADFLVRDLAGLEVPAIVYRAVGKYREGRFRHG